MAWQLEGTYLARAISAHLSTFGVDRWREGQSGFSAPFSWAG